MDAQAGLQEFIAVGQAAFPLFSVLSLVAGLILIGQAGIVMVTAGSPRSRHESLPWGEVGTKFLIGALLAQFARSIEMTQELVGGAGSEVRAGLAYAAPSGGGGAFWEMVLSAAFLWVAVIGAAGMFRGFLLWHKAGSGENQGGGGDFFWRGLWHIVFGAIAINIGSGS